MANSSPNDAPTTTLAQFSWRLQLCASLLLSLCAAGCADGPIPEMRSLNPWVREQWADDEKHGPTFHTRMTRLKELRLQARGLSLEKRAQLSGELAELLKNEESSVMRAEILRSLAAYPSPEALSAVQNALTDGDPQVRICACNALGQWNDADALHSLGTMVGSDSDLDVRIAAVRAMQNYQDPSAIKALSVALDDRDPAIQTAAMQSLKGSTGKDYGMNVVAWRQFVAGETPDPPPPVSIATRLQDLWLW